LVLQKIIEAVGNVSLAIATLFSYLFVAAMEILKVLSVRKDKTRERDEVKTKVEEIKYAKPKEIEHHKWKLEEQIEKACRNHFRISAIQSMEWEMDLVTMKELVHGYVLEITCLQKLVERLETGARTAINWIVFQLTIEIFAIGVLSYWVYIKEDVGISVIGITAVCFLGVATHCIRKAQVLFDSYSLVSECEQVGDELEKPRMACVMYKHTVEDFLPQKKKILHVVDHEIPKCKYD